MNQLLVMIIVQAPNDLKYFSAVFGLNKVLKRTSEALTNASDRSNMRVLKPPTLLLPESGGFFSSKAAIMPL